MLTRETVIDKIEILDTGHVQVRRAMYICEGGLRVAGPVYRRVAYAPGESLLHEDMRVQQHAALAWAPEGNAADRRRGMVDDGHQ